MIVEYFLLADGVHADIDKHHMLGAGWDVLYANSDIFKLAQMSAAVRVRFEEYDAPRVTIEFDIYNDEEESVLPLPLAADAWWQLGSRGTDKLPKRTFIAFTVSQVEFGKPGIFHAVLRSSGTELGRETFVVMDRSPLSSNQELDSAPDRVDQSDHQEVNDAETRSWNRSS